MSIYFIGDTHLFHSNIISLCSRPFASVEEMNKAIVDNWNSVVKDSDTVFMMGDFALCRKEKLIEIGNSLRGIKTLVMGNHDQASAETYHKAGFKYVCKYPIIFSDFFICSHEPAFVNCSSPYANIFAHVHNNPSYKNVSERSFCVSAERIGYTPIRFEDIVEAIKIEQGKKGNLNGKD